MVLYAFENGKGGDIFVQKAPACTIGDLAVAVKELFGAKNEVKIIGTRHGEKRVKSRYRSKRIIRRIIPGYWMLKRYKRFC